MTYKANLGINPRTVYVSKGGSDDYAGDTEETAVGTINQAVTLINALMPPPSVTAPSAIIITGSGIYDELADIPEGCQVNGSSSTIFASSGNAVQPGEQALFFAVSALASDTASTVVRISGKNRVGVTLAAAEVQGDSSFGFHHEPAASDSAAVIRVGFIGEISPTGNTTAIQVTDGHQ